MQQEEKPKIPVAVLVTGAVAVIVMAIAFMMRMAAPKETVQTNYVPAEARGSASKPAKPVPTDSASAGVTKQPLSKHENE